MGLAAAPPPQPPPAPAISQPAPELTEALGVGVGQVSEVSGDETPLIFSVHGEVGRPMVPALRLVVGISALVRLPEPAFEEGMTKPRSQGHVVVGGRLDIAPRLSVAGVAGLAATDYVVDRSCNFLVGCHDEKEVVFGLVAGASARIVLVRREGRWKDIGLEAHVTQAAYMTLGGVLTADVGVVFGRL